MRDSISTLLDLLTRADFLTGLAVGVVGLGILYLLRVVDRPFIGWSLLLTAAGLVGIHLHIGRRLSLILSLAVLALGGWALDHLKEHPGTTRVALLGWGAILAAAVLFSLRSGLPTIGWVRVAGPIVVVASGLAMRAWSESDKQQYFGPLFAISAFGIWTTVPETESARVLLGAAIPMAFGTLRRIGGVITGPGVFALAGLAVWTVARGGETRPASILGGWACVGLLVAIPLFAGHRPIAHVKTWMMVIGHALVVLLASRVVGLQESTTVALVGVSVLALIVAAICVPLLRPHGRAIE